jgi:hypothetical protein
MSVSAKRRSAPRPSPTPDAPAPGVPGDTTVAASVPPKLVYRGDVYGLTIWFGGAIILVLLHIIDAVFWWFQR